MEFPQVFTHEGDSEDEAAVQLARVLADLGISRPFTIASRHGKALIARLSGPTVEASAASADQALAAALGARAQDSGADAIVAVGGGRCLDVAKLVAARAGIAIVTVPTQLSHDGICSPVAVVPDATGRAESLGAISPAAVFVSLPTIAGSPPDSLRAGIGDLLANPLALRDWTLAADRGLEEIDERAWDLSVRSHEVLAPYIEAGTMSGPEFLRALADALVMSGMAMICSGTSRPASGGEHEISHAMDELYGGRAHHGAQVAFGTIISTALYGEDVAAFRDRLRQIGLPQHPSDLGLKESEVVDVVLAAPSTRPGRFTILEDANLDAAGARRLVRTIWRPGG